MEIPFDITNKNQIIKFEEIDPYNKLNIIKGYVNRRQSKTYGSLYITHVNDKPVEQIIFSSPKMHYPFDKNGKWEFPESNTVELYEKIDGTNVVSFVYKDAQGNQYLSFKTRLRPFLGEGKFGNFKALWDEMLDMYPEILNQCFDQSRNYSFELYGKRN